MIQRFNDSKICFWLFEMVRDGISCVFANNNIKKSFEKVCGLLKKHISILLVWTEKSNGGRIKP